MSNLRAEQRPDKNGKIVTRHVKISDAPKSATSLPSPAISPVPQQISHLEVIEDVLLQKMAPEYTVEFIEKLKEKSEVTQAVVAEALVNHESDEEFEAIRHLIDAQRDSSFLQLVATDMKFVMKLSESQISRDPSIPTMKAVGLMQSTFTNRFRTMSGRTRSGEEPDLRKYADRFRASVLARVLDVEDNASSDFEAADQYQHIDENKDMLMKHLGACKSIISTVNERYVSSEAPNSHTALDICHLLEEFPGSDDAVIAIVESRKRYDEAEVREALRGAHSLSQGAL